MKIVKAELAIAKYVHVNNIDPNRDSLYEDVKTSGGRKIVSSAKDLDGDLLSQLKSENDVHKIWVKRSFPKWVFSNQARKRNLTTLEMKTVDVEYGKAIKQLGELTNAKQLRTFLTDLREHASSNSVQTRIKNFLNKVDELIPEVQSFHEKLSSIEHKEKQKEVIQLLKRPQDEIGPVEFPNELKKFARKYMDHLCKLEDMRYKTAGFVFDASKSSLEKLTEQRKQKA